MSITREELKDFAEKSTLKDVRSLNVLIIDLLSPQQLNEIENYFEKSLSLKSTPTPKKKAPEKPITRRQPSEGIEMTQYRQSKRPEPVREEIPEDDDEVDESVFQSDDEDDLDEYEFDTPEATHQQPLSEEDIRKIQERQMQRMGRSEE